MRSRIAEYMKIVSAIGFMHGTKVGLKRNFSSDDFTVQVPGLSREIGIRKNTSDWNAFKQVFIWKEYEYPVRFVPSAILDAGANVGYASLWFARKFPGAKIISLEPDSSNFEMLKRNTNGYLNIFPVKAGLWSHSCFLKVIATDRGDWGFVTEETKNETKDSVKALGVREIMDLHTWLNIDIVKMDIEGAEKNVFARGAEEWLPKVRMMFIELHDNVKKGCSKNVFRALLDYDFSVDIVGENLVLINNVYQ
jgi:FkbM family methyltransferase